MNRRIFKGIAGTISFLTLLTHQLGRELEAYRLVILILDTQQNHLEKLKNTDVQLNAPGIGVCKSSPSD